MEVDANRSIWLPPTTPRARGAGDFAGRKDMPGVHPPFPFFWLPRATRGSYSQAIGPLNGSDNQRVALRSQRACQVQREPVNLEKVLDLAFKHYTPSCA